MSRYSRSLRLLFGLAVAGALAACAQTGTSTKPAASGNAPNVDIFNGVTPVEKHGALSVVGPHIRDQNDQITSLAGPSFFWSNSGWGQERFYTKGAVETFAKDWNAGIIRAAMGAENNGSYLRDPKGNLKRVETVVNAAIENGIYVIIDWHSHSAEKDIEESKRFFTAMAEKYGDYPNVIYEIYNEPLNTTDWSTVVKPYAEELITPSQARAIFSMRCIFMPPLTKRIFAKRQNMRLVKIFPSLSLSGGL